MKAKNYRKQSGQAYTRTEYMGGPPRVRIVKYTMGKPKPDYTHKLVLRPKQKLQIRDQALESARISAGRILTRELLENYYLEIKAHPHVVVRENKMLYGAHADRLQEGMRRAFGKLVGRVARVSTGDPVIVVHVYEGGVNAAKYALQVAGKKLPKAYTVSIEKIPS